MAKHLASITLVVPAFYADSFGISEDEYRAGQEYYTRQCESLPLELTGPQMVSSIGGQVNSAVALAATVSIRGA